MYVGRCTCCGAAEGLGEARAPRSGLQAHGTCALLQATLVPDRAGHCQLRDLPGLCLHHLQVRGSSATLGVFPVGPLLSSIPIPGITLLAWLRGRAGQVPALGGGHGTDSRSFSMAPRPRRAACPSGRGKQCWCAGGGSHDMRDDCGTMRHLGARCSTSLPASRHPAGTPGTGGVLRGRAAAAQCRCCGCCPGQRARPRAGLSSPLPDLPQHAAAVAPVWAQAPHCSEPAPSMATRPGLGPGVLGSEPGPFVTGGAALASPPGCCLFHKGQWAGWQLKGDLL